MRKKLPPKCSQYIVLNDYLIHLTHAHVAGHDDLCGVLHGAALLQPAQPHQADHGETL